MVTKSISAETAIINLHPNDRGRRGKLSAETSALPRDAERLPFCITIMSVTPTTTELTESGPMSIVLIQKAEHSLYNLYRESIVS